jgi:hypothetical protein
LVGVPGWHAALALVCLDAGFYRCYLKLLERSLVLTGRRVSAGAVALFLLPKIFLVCFA